MNKKKEIVFIVHTSSFNWGKGRTLTETLVNSKFKSSEKVVLTIIQGVYEHAGVTDIGQIVYKGSILHQERIEGFSFKKLTKKVGSIKKSS